MRACLLPSLDDVHPLPLQIEWSEGLSEQIRPVIHRDSRQRRSRELGLGLPGTGTGRTGKGGRNHCDPRREFRGSYPNPLGNRRHNLELCSQTLNEQQAEVLLRR